MAPGTAAPPEATASTASASTKVAFRFDSEAVPGAADLELIELGEISVDYIRGRMHSLTTAFDVVDAQTGFVVKANVQLQQLVMRRGWETADKVVYVPLNAPGSSRTAAAAARPAPKPPAEPQQPSAAVPEAAAKVATPDKSPSGASCTAAAVPEAAAKAATPDKSPSVSTSKTGSPSAWSPIEFSTPAHAQTPTSPAKKKVTSSRLGASKSPQTPATLAHVITPPSSGRAERRAGRYLVRAQPCDQAAELLRVESITSSMRSMRLATPSPGPPSASLASPEPLDPLLAPIAEFARAEVEREDLAAGLALYVPPLAADRTKAEPLDLHEAATAFLGPLAGGGFRAAPHRLLLLLGDAGTSKTTYLRFLHREACSLWAAGRPPGVPVTVLVPLMELAGARSGLREFVAGRLGVPSGELPALARRAGLVLLFDGYGEAGERENLWRASKLGEFASGAVVACRTEYFAALGGPDALDTFAPDAETSKIRQLATLPFTRYQVAEYLSKHAAHHGADEGAWGYEQYADELRRTPGLAVLAHNPFELSLAARVLPARAAARPPPSPDRRRALRSRELYRLFIEDWIRRELSGSRARHADFDTALLQTGYGLCRCFAVLLFRMGASYAVVPAGGSADRSPEQRECERLLDNSFTLLVRNSCPLRRWDVGTGKAQAFAFVHKTVGEFLVAEALLESLTGASSSSTALTSVDLSTRSIAQDARLVRFLAEAVQYDPTSGAAAALLQIVENSRADDASPAAIVAAANAATVLVAAHYSLAGRDLRGVRLPGANLWRLEAAGADLRGADLRGCSLNEAILSRVALGGARLEGCRVSTHPALCHPNQQPVFAVAWMPDGRRVVSGCGDGLVRVWGVAGGEELLRLEGHEGKVAAVAVAAGGKRIVSGGADATVRVWDVESGKELQLLRGHAEQVTAVAASADGKRIASASTDRTVRIWSEGSEAAALTLEGHARAVYAVAVSSDGKRVASGGEDASVRVWDGESGEELHHLQGHTQPVRAVAISTDGKRIVSGSDDQSIRVWDGHTGAELLELWGHSQAILAVAFSPDAARIVSGSKDRSVRVWDVTSGLELRPLQGHGGGVASVAFSADGERVASGSVDASVRVWGEPDPGLQQLAGHAAEVKAVALSPDGRRIVSGGEDAALRVWEAVSGSELLHLQGHTGPVTAAAISADGRRIVSGGADRSVKLWDGDSGEELLHFDGHEDRVTSVAVTADGSRVVSGSDDQSVRIWDARSGEELLRLRGHSSRVTAVAVSSDGRRVVSGSDDHLVKVWDAATGARLLLLRGHTGMVTAVALSADGRRVVSASRDATVRVWDSDSGKELLQLRGNATSVEALAISADGKRIVSGSDCRIVRISDAESGATLLQLRGHADWVTSVAISADGKRIVSGSDDRTVRVWDAECGCGGQRPTEHDPVIDLAINDPDAYDPQAAGRPRPHVCRWDPSSGDLLELGDGEEPPASPPTSPAVSPMKSPVGPGAGGSGGDRRRVLVKSLSGGGAVLVATDSTGLNVRLERIPRFVCTRRIAREATLEVEGATMDAGTRTEPRLRRLFLQRHALEHAPGAGSPGGSP